jgi:hypothetical protein
MLVHALYDTRSMRKSRRSLVSVTVSGIFFFALVLYVLVKTPDRLPYYVVFFAPFSATAVINFTGLGYKSGGLGLTPAMLFLFGYFCSQVGFGFALRRGTVSKGLLIQISLIGLFVVILLASLAVNGLIERPTPFQITQTIYVLLGAATTVALSFEFCRQEAIERAVKVVRAAAVFTSLWGWLQVGCFVAGVPYPSFLFNNSLSDFADMFDQHGANYMRIASVAVEPSFFAASLLHFVTFGITVLVCEPRLRTRGWILSVAVCTVTLLGCSSSTGYFGLAVLALVLLIRSPLRSAAFGVMGSLAFLVLVASIPKFSAVLISATVDKGQSVSYTERAAATFQGFQMFLRHPLIGGGWGRVRPPASAITMVLADVGLIGTTVFLITCIATLFELQSRRSANLCGPHWRLAAYAAGVQNALIVAFACAVVSSIKYVVLDDWYFWAIGIATASRLPRVGRVLDERTSGYFRQPLIHQVFTPAAPPPPAVNHLPTELIAK